VVLDVLSAEKDSVSEILKKHAGWTRPATGSSLKPLIAFTFSFYFAQFAGFESAAKSNFFRHSRYCRAGMLLMCGCKAFQIVSQTDAPRSYKEHQEWVAGVILHRDLRDLICAGGDTRDRESQDGRIELHNRISIGNGFVQFTGDDASVNVSPTGLKIDVRSYYLSDDQSLELERHLTRSNI